MIEITIDHDIPVPTTEGSRSGGSPVYPWGDLKCVGDSFLVEGKWPRVSNIVRAAGHQYAKRHGMKFTVRRQPTGVRVWRIA